jgi:hypothetical protein
MAGSGASKGHAMLSVAGLAGGMLDCLQPNL